MSPLVGFALVGGLVVSVGTSAGIAGPPAVAESGRPAAAIAAPGRSLGPLEARTPQLVEAAAPPSSDTAGPQTDGAIRPATAPKSALSPQLVNPETSSAAHTCAAALHGIVGPECPSK